MPDVRTGAAALLDAASSASLASLGRADVICTSTSHARQPVQWRHCKWLQVNRTHLQSHANAIKLICTDVDGTLLNSDNVMLESSKRAMMDATNAGIPVRIVVVFLAYAILTDQQHSDHRSACSGWTSLHLPVHLLDVLVSRKSAGQRTTHMSMLIASAMQVAITTGKSATGPWLDEIMPHLPSDTPSVFCQGALLTDKEGNIISQESLNSKTIERILQFAEQHELAVAAFTGNDVIAKEQSQHTQNLIDIKEMEPRGVDFFAGPCTYLHLAYRCSTST